jgi:hypothetical protein
MFGRHPPRPLQQIVALPDVGVHGAQCVVIASLVVVAAALIVGILDSYCGRCMAADLSACEIGRPDPSLCRRQIKIQHRSFIRIVPSRVFIMVLFIGFDSA